MWAEPLCGLRSWTKKSQNPSLCFLTRDTRLPPQLSAAPTIMPPPFSEEKKKPSLYLLLLTCFLSAVGKVLITQAPIKYPIARKDGNQFERKKINSKKKISKSLMGKKK